LGESKGGLVSQQVGRAFTIRIEFERRSTTPVRELVIWLTDEPAQPYWVLSWTNMSA
jgi:general secretion pathway protein K